MSVVGGQVYYVVMFSLGEGGGGNGATDTFFQGPKNYQFEVQARYLQHNHIQSPGPTTFWAFIYIKLGGTSRVGANIRAQALNNISKIEGVDGCESLKKRRAQKGIQSGFRVDVEVPRVMDILVLGSLHSYSGRYFKQA